MRNCSERRRGKKRTGRGGLGGTGTRRLKLQPGDSVQVMFAPASPATGKVLAVDGAYARVDIPGNFLGPGWYPVSKVRLVSGGFGLGWVPGAVWYSQQSQTTRLILLGLAAALAGAAVAKVVD